MSLEALRHALDALDEPTSCEGTHRLDEPLALMLPDGDVGALGDPAFVEWLLAHSELAPFGDGFVTRVDPGVRNVQRVIGRGAIDVSGFDVTAILPAIEEALSPTAHLTASLTDVLVYNPGGKFVRHRDTPYTRDLVGTLVVGLPIAHTGGAFIVDDGAGKKSYDWGTPVDDRTVRWVALFADVDHEVAEVVSGARVTLVYSLDSTYVPRDDPRIRAKLATVQAAIARLELGGEPIMVACARHVITGKTPPTIGSLRGIDREVAQLFVQAGYKVTVRSCLAATSSDGSERPRLAPNPWGDDFAVARLRDGLTRELLDSLGPVHAFVPQDQCSGDDGGGWIGFDDEPVSLAPHLMPELLPHRWVIRTKAAATLIHETAFDEYGFFGNGGFEALLYTLAALEITPRT
ncbi:MAG TPA: 2OG-Fe(II) oxygenase [Kofleriaceae bacterium]|nr:2OG-Fe(II) oxygenase [Kofleriaceae bacterium]